MEHGIEAIVFGVIATLGNGWSFVRTQDRVRDREVVHEMVDPMPRLVILRQRYRDQE